MHVRVRCDVRLLNQHARSLSLEGVHRATPHLDHCDSASPFLDKEQVHQAVTQPRCGCLGHVVRNVLGLHSSSMEGSGEALVLSTGQKPYDKWC